MPADIFYGSDTQLRIGLMANLQTDPTVWHSLEFISLTVSPQRDRRARPKLGSARHNALDPIKPIDSFFRLSMDLVVDADTRQLPRLLRSLLGAPTTTGPVGSIYTHVWNSGGQTVQLAAIALQTASGEFRVYRGLTLGAISMSAAGENVQDFDVQLSLRGVSRATVASWPTGTNNAVPAASPVNRAVFRVDSVAATNTLSASWTYDRGITEDLFLSTTAQISGLRPGDSSLTGQAQFRATSTAFDTMEENGTEFLADIQGLGLVPNHEIRFAHLQAQLNAAPLVINGPGLIERTFSWMGYQDATDPGARITVANDVVSYAT